MRRGYPERIVCLTEETTETLYLLGEEARIVGISGFTVRPPRARREKPKVSAFTSAKTGRIVALRPDLVLGFSDLQAGIAADLAREGIEVHLFNHRSVAEILRMIRMLGGMVGCAQKAEALAGRLEAGVAATREAASRLPRRPRVYFEEWDEPLIAGIGWISELVGIAGGEAGLERGHQVRDLGRSGRLGRGGDLLAGRLALDQLEHLLAVLVAVARGVEVGGEGVDELAGHQ